MHLSSSPASRPACPLSYSPSCPCRHSLTPALVPSRPCVPPGRSARLAAAVSFLPCVAWSIARHNGQTVPFYQVSTWANRSGIPGFAGLTLTLAHQLSILCLSEQIDTLECVLTRRGEKMKFKDLSDGAWFSFDRRGISGAIGLISGPFQKLSPSTYRYYHQGQWYTTVVGHRAARVELVSAEELEDWARS